MSNVARVLGSAGNTQGIPLKSENIFNTSVWTGTGASRTITNNVNLSGEGGLTWIKARSGSSSQHALFDTERGVLKGLASSSTAVEADEANSVSAFNTNGFDLGSWSGVNGGSTDYVGWTFRKAPKFFDIVTYTGTGSARTVSHNLGSTPGMIIVKQTSGATRDWEVYHREIYPTNLSLSGHFKINLNKTDARSNEANIWNDTAPTSTEFTVGSDNATNSNGETYVAYLFAHNDGDGEFGPDADQDIIKCGSYTEVNGADVRVDLGFEPQWIIIKVTNTTGGWGMYDVMRGWTSGSDDFALGAHSANAESNVGDRWLIHPDGFTWKNTGNTRNIMYMAIRRGGMDAPTSATDVFGAEVGGNSGSAATPEYTPGFSVDMAIAKRQNGSNGEIYSRLTAQRYLIPNSTAAEASSSNAVFDYQDGYFSTGSPYFSWMWKRARSYFDVVTYTGTGAATQNITHNLGVAPEMMWIKCRSNAENWVVYHSYNNTKKWYLNLNAGQTNAGSQDFNDTPPTSSVFTVGDGNDTGANNRTYIAYLFATAPGVSKVGSYTGNGNATGPIVDCGFTSGARFVLLKRTTGLQNWYIYDTVRGLTSGDDKELELNSTSSERTGEVLSPHSSGFQLATASTFANENGVNYIFYAIA